ncbi:MAG: radical SAM protein, partial [Marinilabiliales bacterium]
HFQKRLSEDFIQLNQVELIKEMRTFISKTKLNSTIFRSNHASNYLILKGVLGKDEENMLAQIDDFLHNPNLNLLRKEWERGL